MNNLNRNNLEMTFFIYQIKIKEFSLVLLKIK